MPAHQFIFKLMSYEEKRRPSTSERHLGIEIEFRLRNERDASSIRTALNSAGLEPYTMFHHESLSLGVYGWELTFCVRAAAYKKILRRALGIVQEFSAYTDRFCGCHLHLDARKVSAFDLRMALIPFEDEILKQVDPDRISRRGWGYEPYYENRSGKETLEVRYRHSDFDYPSLTKYIDFILEKAYADQTHSDQPVQNGRAVACVA